MALPSQAEFLDVMTRILRDKRRWPMWALTEALVSHFKLTKSDLTIKQPGTKSTLFNEIFCNAHIDLFEQEALTKTYRTGQLRLNDDWIEARKSQEALIVPESSWRLKRGDIRAELSKAASNPYFQMETENLVRSTLVNNGEGALQEKINSTPLNMHFSLFCWGTVVGLEDESVHICFYTPFATRRMHSTPSVVRKFLEESRMLNCTRNILFTPLKFTSEERDLLEKSGLNVRAFDVDDIVDALVEDGRALVYNQVEGTFSLNPAFLSLPRD